MNLKCISRKCCLSTILVILFCALAMSGCDRGPKTPKAATAPDAPASPAAPAAPAASKIPGPPGAQAAPAIKAAPVPQARVGKYLNKKYPHDFIELKSDGTFAIQEGKNITAGAYTVLGKNITFALKSGSGSACIIDDRGITDSNGEVWAKQ